MAECSYPERSELHITRQREALQRADVCHEGSHHGEAIGARFQRPMKTDQLARSKEHIHEVTKARAIDGDSIIGLINLGFGMFLERRIRLKGFFAPEHGGQSPDAALAAQQELQYMLDRCVITFPARGAREDRYGRLLVTLLFNGQPLTGDNVLGPYQLTETAHAHDLAVATRNRKRGGVAL